MVVFGPLFLKKLKSFKMLSFTIRRKNMCFDGAFFKKIYPFRIYGDLMALLGACFLKKVLIFTIRRFQSSFGSLQNESYI